MTDLPTSPEEMLSYVRKRSVTASPFTAWLGIDLVRCWDGEAEMIIPLRPDLLQHMGTVHGAIIGTAADNVSCWAAASRAGPLVTANYTIHFLAPAVGEVLRAIGRTIRIGRRTAVVAADIFVEKGKASTRVATALVEVARLTEEPIRRSPGDE
jgi:uncharacterized protein (TIGR00369 family)